MLDIQWGGGYLILINYSVYCEPSHCTKRLVIIEAKLKKNYICIHTFFRFPKFSYI